MTSTRIPEVLKRHEAEILAEWIKAQLAGGIRRELINDSELREECGELLRLLTRASEGGLESSAAGYQPVKDFLTRLSRTRSVQGFTASETATFILSLKQPIFGWLRREAGSNAEALGEELWRATVLLDQLALFTTEADRKAREEVISRQQQDMMELSTPVVELWKGVLALPLIGTLDSSRSQTVMENLLRRIVETRSHTAIIDITGVPTVDTLTAQHLLKTVTATRLMGAECLISGIRPQIAQTIVHLGVDLTGVTTKATLAGAFATALARSGLTVHAAPKGARPLAAAPQQG